MELILSPAGRRYGYFRDARDERDLPAPAFEAAEEVEPLVDLEEFMGPVFDQGQQGSCTANAGCGVREYLVRKFPQLEPELGETDPQSVIFSRAYLYYAERAFDGDPQQDGGSTGRSACRVMNGKSSDIAFPGVCLDSTMPYRDSDFQTVPDADQIAEAKKFVAGAYHRLNPQDVIACLNSGYPVLLGFAVYSSFESGAVAANGFVPLPAPGEPMLGGHEVVIIGHNAGPQVGNWPSNTFKVRNSWGEGWGDKGNFYLSDAFVFNPNLAWDFWMIHLGKAW